MPTVYYAWVGESDPVRPKRVRYIRSISTRDKGQADAWWKAERVGFTNLTVGEYWHFSPGDDRVIESVTGKAYPGRAVWDVMDLPALVNGEMQKAVGDAALPDDAATVVTLPPCDQGDLWHRVMRVKAMVRVETAEAVAMSAVKTPEGSEAVEEPYARIALHDSTYAALTSGAVPTNGPEKAAMDFPAAELVTLGKGQVIAVLDTGCDHSHPSLKFRVFPSIDCTVGTSGGEDTHGHGTAVVSQIIADLPSGTPIGTARMVSIVPIKVMGGMSGTGKDSTIARGVRAARQIGADIILMCFGSETELPETKLQLVAAASEGITCIAAAGNGGGDVDDIQFPARHACVISVGSCNPDGSPSTFTSRGPSLDVYALGHLQPVAMLGGGYSRWSGTSMAAPHVAAAVAMWRAVRKELGWPRPGTGGTFTSIVSASKGAIYDDGVLKQRGLIQAGKLLSGLASPPPVTVAVSRADSAVVESRLRSTADLITKAYSELSKLADAHGVELSQLLDYDHDE